MSVRQGTRYYTVSLPPDIGAKVESLSDGDPLGWLARLVTSMVGMGECVHPPALVSDGGFPQCLGCAKFL